MNNEILEKIKEIIFKAVCSKNIYSDQAMKMGDDAFSKIKQLLQKEEPEKYKWWICEKCSYKCEIKISMSSSNLKDICMIKQKPDWQPIKRG